MKIKPWVFFLLAFLTGGVFVCRNKQSRHDLSLESKYETAIQNIVDMLSVFHTNYIVLSNGKTNIDGLVMSRKMSFAGTKVPFSRIDQWGGELSITVQSNRYIQIISAGPDMIFNSCDDIIGKLTLTNSLQIEVHGKYKDSVFNSSIFSTDCE